MPGRAGARGAAALATRVAPTAPLLPPSCWGPRAGAFGRPAAVLVDASQHAASAQPGGRSCKPKQSRCTALPTGAQAAPCTGGQGRAQPKMQQRAAAGSPRPIGEAQLGSVGGPGRRRQLEWCNWLSTPAGSCPARAGTDAAIALVGQQDTPLHLLARLRMESLSTAGPRLAECLALLAIGHQLRARRVISDADGQVRNVTTHCKALLCACWAVTLRSGSPATLWAG